MGFSSDKIEKVLDLIYDAAAENDLWPHALTAIADLTRSEGGILFGQSYTAQRIYFDFNGRLNETCNLAYQERHMQNPWSLHMEHQPAGRLVLSDEAVSPGDLQKSAFLPRDVDGRLLTILISSIRGKDLGRLSDAGVKDAAVLLFVIDPANRRSIPLGQIMDAYGLTHAEARVALAASSGNTIIENAKSLGLSPNTVKTHLRHVFAKTATGRQAELASLIAAIGSVRIGDVDSEH